MSVYVTDMQAQSRTARQTVREEEQGKREGEEVRKEESERSRTEVPNHPERTRGTASLLKGLRTRVFPSGFSIGFLRLSPTRLGFL